MRRVLEGTIMKDREFDDDEIDYLRSLPAVNSVGRNRIRYTGQFREYCMQRYRAGDSPTGIFRDVGLDPSLIGYKRIERCIARWKQQERDERDELRGEGFGVPPGLDALSQAGVHVTPRHAGCSPRLAWCG